MFRFAFVALLGLVVQASAQDGFALKDTPGEHLDVLLDGKIAARYMYAHDVSKPDKRIITYKPYLHVFDADGKGPITKGPGGQFPHHRGIFVGWNKIAFNGKSYDRWHMTGGDIVHEKFTDLSADKTSATFTSHTHWYAEAGKSMIDEARTLTFKKAPGTGRLFIELTTKISAPLGDVTLDGDPEHAGVQFRPANEVTGAETVYVYPGEKANAQKDRDYPWVGESFTLAGKRYSVVIFNSPENPKNTRFSAYRDYGRFGAFAVATVTPTKPLTLRYAFLIADGEMPAAADVQKIANTFTGVKTPSPVPMTTILKMPPAKK